MSKRSKHVFHCYVRTKHTVQSQEKDMTTCNGDLGSQEPVDPESQETGLAIGQESCERCGRV